MNFPDIAAVVYQELRQECWNNYVVIIPRKGLLEVEPKKSISESKRILESICGRYDCSIAAIDNAIHISNNSKIGNFFSADGSIGRNHFRTASLGAAS